MGIVKIVGKVLGTMALGALGAAIANRIVPGLMARDASGS